MHNINKIKWDTGWGNDKQDGQVQPGPYKKHSQNIYSNLQQNTMLHKDVWDE